MPEMWWCKSHITLEITASLKKYGEARGSALTLFVQGFAGPALVKENDKLENEHLRRQWIRPFRRGLDYGKIIYRSNCLLIHLGSKDEENIYKHGKRLQAFTKSSSTCSFSRAFSILHTTPSGSELTELSMAREG